MLISELWRYPVKSFAGERLDAAELGAAGIPGDRRWAVVDGSGPVSAKREGALMQAAAEGADEPRLTLPGGRALSASDPDASEVLSAWLGRTVGLVRRPEGVYDAEPIHVLCLASLEELRRRVPAAAIEARRFRPNVVVAGAAEPFCEAGWPGRLLRVGAAVLRVVKPTRRCVMTTHAQHGLPRQPEVLKAVVDAAGGALGAYARVERPGLVRPGDAVAVVG